VREDAIGATADEIMARADGVVAVADRITALADGIMALTDRIITAVSPTIVATNRIAAVASASGTSRHFDRSSAGSGMVRWIDAQVTTDLAHELIADLRMTGDCRTSIQRSTDEPGVATSSRRVHSRVRRANGRAHAASYGDEDFLEVLRGGAGVGAVGFERLREGDPQGLEESIA
jgi:hypothetical protein